VAERSPAQWGGIYLRGIAMGIAEVIPGVSGGTIAFITGIYSELLHTLAQLRPTALPNLWRDGVARFWRRYNLSFLLVLGLGMATSVLLFANVMHHLLATVPILVWAFFFGLILAACIDIGSQNRALPLLTAGALGLAVGVGLTLIGSDGIQASYPMLFLGGAVAVTAWLLPGISGSYMLLLMGLYPTFIAALAGLQLDVLFVFGLGLVLGLMLFARLLVFLLHRYYHRVMALLTGFMAGSLLMLWPWRIELERQFAGRAVQVPVAPWRFAEATGQEPAVGGALVMAAVGILVVFLLTRVRHVAAVEHG
jgi:putative membrane protein